MRSPAAVISGYARMLREGRLDEAERGKAVDQIQRATALLGEISRQASDLALWFPHSPTAPSGHFVLGSLIEHAIARVSPPAVVTADVASLAKTREIPCLDRGALSSALASLIEAARREAGHAPLTVTAPDSGAGDAAGQHVIIGPSASADARHAIAASAERDPFLLERGGLGLALVVAMAVFDAHRVRVWQLRGSAGVIGLTIPDDL